MNKIILKEELDKLNVPAFYYSLNGELLPDRIILSTEDNWNVFYLDERGNRHQEKIFNSEKEACCRRL